MQKQNDSVQQFTTLRAALLREREAIQKRLQLINAALGGATTSSPAVPTVAAPKAASAKSTARLPRRVSAPRSNNALSIREAITKVTAKQPMNVRDIVNAVQKIGYKFQSSNPINSVGAYLYGANGKKHFKRTDGKFKAA